MMRFAHLFGVSHPSHVPTGIRSDALLGNDLHLIEFKLDGSFTAKHGNNHADRILVDLQALDGAGKRSEGAVKDAHSIANCVVEKREIVVNYAVGDTVRILDGPLSSFTGVVESLEVDKNTVSVIVSMFGRETPVEFELDQIELQSQ